MRYWKAHYRDEFHDEDILIANEQRQETYVCPDFAVRDQCEGYRGFVEE